MMMCNRFSIRTRTLCSLPLLGALLLSGCKFPSPPVVSVTIKSAGGEDEGTAEVDPDDAGVSGYGTLTGRVTFDGTPPNLTPLVNQGDAGVKDSSVCSIEAVPDESLEIDPATKGIGNVVIYLAKPPKYINPDLASAETDVEPAVFDQKGCKFFPHILPVRVDLDQPLVVKSDDGIAHNTHTYPQRNSQFNQAVKANDRDGIPIKYSRAESEPLRVTCDYHSWMKAYHFPIDHPYFAITKPDGTFTIEGLPAGKHEFKVWQERGGLIDRKLEVTINPDETTTIDPAKTTYSPDKFKL